MSKDQYDQGYMGRTTLHRQSSTNKAHVPDSGESFLAQSSHMQRPHLDEHALSHKDIPHTLWKAQQDRDLAVQQHLYTEPNHLSHEEHVGYTHQAASTMPQGQNNSATSSTGVDGHSLYCTEVLPSSSPPSHSVSVDGVGANRRAPLVVNGGTGAQPVQYTIIIADPQLQQNGSTTRSLSSGATNILFNTLVQQQQLQHHLVSISKANNSLNSFITGPNSGIIVNSSSLNGSNKFNNLLNTSNNKGSSGSAGSNSATTFPTNLIANGLNNNLDGKSISISLSPNSKLPSAVFDSGGTEAGILILNYTDSGEPSATLANINQLVTVHSSDFVTQGNLLKTSASDCNNQAQPLVVKSDSYQLVSGTRQDSRNSAVYNGHFVETESPESSDNSKSSQVTKHSSEHRLLDSSSSERLSRGMHSGRIGAGSGQPLSTHQQQQHHSPNTTSTTSTAVSNQSIMLSAGQPALPSGIFRTGAENSSPTHQIAASGNASFNPNQYAPIYGIHSQSPGHMTTIQPYGTFFPGFGGSGTSTHGFTHGSLMTSTSQSHYPRIESYSAMLASIGSQAQHHGVQGTERTSRVQASSVSTSQRPFVSSGAHMTSAGAQYSATQRRLSETSSPSPGPPQPTSNLSSHHLEKLAAVKGGNVSQPRDVEVARIYGDAASGLEDKPSLSPSSSYPTSTHVPKVSFDSVVKEYGGRDSPTGRGDFYSRVSLSGKEGSLKHRILTRPSDTEVADDLSKVSGVHGLKDEPISKRPKVSGSSSVPYSSPAHNVDNQRSNVHHGSLSHAISCHSPVNNNNSKMNIDNRGHYPENNTAGHQSQPLSPYQQRVNDDNSSRYKQQQYYSASPNWSTPPSSPSSENPSSHLQYPTHFMKGSIIQLADGTLKRVEDLRTEDFVNSAEISSDLKVDSSTVVKIEEHPDRGTAMLSFSVGEHRVQVTVEATLEHPFFVFDQGWSSCSVTRTLARYGLDCQKLNVGDVCISLTHKDVCLKAAEISQQQQQEQSYLAEEHGRLGSASPTVHHTTASALSSSVQSSSPSASGSVTSVSLKVETEASFISPHSSAPLAAVNKRRISQNELPPPQSNIVPVKKENSNNSHKARRRGVSQRNDGDVKEEEEADYDPDSDSTSSLRQRRWSAPDPVTVKADQDRERERQIQADEAQKAEEAFQKIEDNGHHH